MIKNLTKTEYHELYKSPVVKVVPVNISTVLCNSQGDGTESPDYEDGGDGGFH